MAVIDPVNIVGYRVDGKIFHVTCTDINSDWVSEDDIVARSEVEKDDKVWLCDKCGEQLCKGAE